MRRLSEHITGPSTPTFGRDEARRFRVAGQDVSCPVCRTDRFWSRTSLIANPTLAFIGGSPMDRVSYLLVCRLCSHVLWFHDDALVRPLEETD